LIDEQWFHVTNDRPTKRIERLSRTAYRINRAKGVVVVDAGPYLVVTVGAQTLKLTKREALELTVALVKLTNHT
jgi:hypothetical protein